MERRRRVQDDQDAGPDEVTLSVPLASVCYIVEKAYDLQGKTASSVDPADEDDDATAAVLEDRSSDPVRLELTSVISDLNDDAQIDLVALMWLGRDGGDWSELRALAEQEHTAGTARYLCGTPHLADHLLEGLSLLGRDCSEWFEHGV